MRNLKLIFLTGAFFFIVFVFASVFRYDYDSGGKDERIDRWFGVREIACEEDGYIPLQECFKQMESKYTISTE